MSQEKDRILIAQIMGAAGRHAADRPFDLAAAVADVKAIAGTRADLLAEAAGTYLGTVQIDPHHWYYPLAAQICIDAGANFDLIAAAVDRARHRADRTWVGITAPHESVKPREAGPAGP